MTASKAAVAGAGLVPTTLALGQFLMTLDSSVMNVSMATVAADLGTTVTGIQTAITLYTLVMASLMIVGGKLGALLGYRRAFAIGLVIYAAGSLTPPSRRPSAGSSSAGRWRASARRSSCRPSSRSSPATSRLSGARPPTA